MYNDKIYLTPEEILNHEFKIDARGYRPQEVDKFLDMVIRDYSEFNNMIKILKNDLENLNNDNKILKQELRRMQAEADTHHNDGKDKTVTNVDLLQRISQLEKAVYGKNE